MRFALLAALALSFVLTSCDAVSPPDGFEDRWEWVLTGPRFRQVTPDSVGYDLSLTFDNGDFALYRDGALVQEGAYDLGPDDQEGYVSIEFLPLPDDPVFTAPAGGLFFAAVVDGNLLLTEACCNRPYHQYRRAGQ